MTWPYEQRWEDYKAGTVLACLTADIPTKATEDNHLDVGSLIVETDGKKSHVITAVAEDGTITKQQIGAWT